MEEVLTLVHSLMLSLSLVVSEVRLDWLSVFCIVMIWSSQLSYLGNSVGKVSPSLAVCHGYYIVSPEQLFFHFPRKIYICSLLALLCFIIDLYSSFHGTRERDVK